MAEKQLRSLSQFSGKSIFVYKLIHFYGDGRIITKLQNPFNLNILMLIYRDGHWQDPKPEIFRKNDEIKKI
ncbi:hypothetical protein [Chryseobacterium indoltheticum]|uniref:hypothetical protein n=1 Tax=Chryseobacterium indoltheticum TaxID=254 RepID=UPI003F4977EF